MLYSIILSLLPMNATMSGIPLSSTQSLEKTSKCMGVILYLWHLDQVQQLPIVRNVKWKNLWSGCLELRICFQLQNTKESTSNLASFMRINIMFGLHRISSSWTNLNSFRSFNYKKIDKKNRWRSVLEGKPFQNHKIQSTIYKLHPRY